MGGGMDILFYVFFFFFFNIIHFFFFSSSYTGYGSLRFKVIYLPAVTSSFS